MVDEIDEGAGLGFAARVGVALAVVLVGLGTAAAALTLEVVDDEAQRVGAFLALGDENLGHGRALEHARHGGHQGRPQRPHGGGLVDDGAANEVGVVGLPDRVAVVHENIRAGPHRLVQAIHQVLDGGGRAGAVVLNLGEAHDVGIQLLNGENNFGALAREIGRGFGPARGGEFAARAVAVEVVEHVEAGQLQIERTEGRRREGPHRTNDGGLGSGQRLQAPTASAVAQNAAHPGQSAAHAHGMKAGVEVGRGRGVSGRAAVVEHQAFVVVGGLVGPDGRQVAGAAAAGAGGGVVVGVDELRGLVGKAGHRNRQLAALPQVVVVRHGEGSGKLHPHSLVALGRRGRKRAVGEQDKRRRRVARRQHRDNRLGEHRLPERWRSLLLAHHPRNAHPVAHRHRGAGLRHKQGIRRGGVAVGRGLVVLHVEAGGLQARVHARYDSFDGVATRPGGRPPALNGTNSSGSGHRSGQQASPKNGVFI